MTDKPDFIKHAESRRALAKDDLVAHGKAMAQNLHKLSRVVRLHNALWEIDIDTGEPLVPNPDQMLMLTVGELAEAHENVRRGWETSYDKHLGHRLGLEVELADTLIRILHMGVRFGLDVPGAVIEILLRNIDRPDHQYEARIAKHGKKI